jgi:hypothetical protein
VAALPAIIHNSRLWVTTLAPRTDDPNGAVRERLRSSFIQFRERAAFLASEIRRDLPNLTVHDVTHLDSLWEIASTITGDSVNLTPTEAFVLGGSFLLHDLAMSVAATPGGYPAITHDVRWADLVHTEYWSVYGRSPLAEEVLNPEPSVARAVLFNLLRQIHAANAEKLAFLSFPSTEGTALFLIEDTELRQTFGRAIGRIAHSHWWSIGELERNFTQVIGAPHWCPPEWTVDPLKLACILRTADAAHLDAGRAPTYLKALTHPTGTSESHWRFQEKLNKPYVADDALVFTSGAAFSLPDASAWWLCLETLRMVDRELRAVDVLLADRRQPRFVSRRVAGVDLPERLTAYVQTDGWLPINATVHVSDLPRVIKSLGGEELYGRDPAVALREMIQNSCDAVRARRYYEGRPESFGSITVGLDEERDVFTLEVLDTGIGMSQRVLTEFLLDFGRTFWGSPEMQEELPGLVSRGVRAVGKYGIGFFSVFMIADQVQVTTRRSDSAARDTLILEFGSGLEGRPALRPANRDEQLAEGGTRVRLRLKKAPDSDGGLLHNHRTAGAYSITELCRRLCPAIDVDLLVRTGAETALAVGAADWLTMDGTDFLARVDVTNTLGKDVDEESLVALRRRASANLRFLRDNSGGVIGRAAITIGWAHQLSRPLESLVDLDGIVVVGGLRACTLSGITGVLLGTPERAARDAAIPLVTSLELKRWAEEQVPLVPKLWTAPLSQAACAQYIRICGGHAGGLPIAEFRGKWVSASDIEMMVDGPQEVVILDGMMLNFTLRGVGGDYVVNNNVFVTATSGLPGLLQSPGRTDWPEGRERGFLWQDGQAALTLGGAVVEALSIAWKVNVSDLITDGAFDREHDEEVAARSDGSAIQMRALRIRKPDTRPKPRRGVRSKVRK